MSKAVLFYPEFPNTFFLTYDILVNPKSYGGFEWETRPCDWNDTVRIVQGETEELEDDNVVICYFGTENSYLQSERERTGSTGGECTLWRILKRVFSFVAQGKKGGSNGGNTPEGKDLNGYSCKRIQLPSYHPRFVFIPYDFNLYDDVYLSNQSINTDESITDRIDTARIITAKDIDGFPNLNDKRIKDFLKKRGVKWPFFSDTKSQASYLQDKLLGIIGHENRKNHPIRIYYYGAPLTIFYLHLYPEFLPIKIDDSLIDEGDKDYQKKFNTYLYVYYKKETSIENQIESLVEIIRTTFFKAYDDAISEPQMLTPMFKKYKENVPRGQFYTMRNIEDFAKAITLHCNPEIDTIKQEIWGTANRTVDSISVSRAQILQDIKDRTSDSLRNKDTQRVQSLNKIKRIAFGCKVFLLVHYFHHTKGADYFKEVPNSRYIHKERLPKRVKYLYDSVITCLTWEYVLSMTNAVVSDVSGAILTESKSFRNHSNNDNLYLRYKNDEKEVIDKHNSFKAGKKGPDYQKEDLEKLVAYTEYVVKQYVEESIQNKSVMEQNDAYNQFVSLVNGSKSRNDRILMAFLKKFAPYKVFEYQKKHKHE